MSRTLFGALSALTLATGALVPAPQAAAQTLASERVSCTGPSMCRATSRCSFRLPQPGLQDRHRPAGDRQDHRDLGVRRFYVQGIEFGATNMLVYGKSVRGLSEVIDVRVGFDADGLQQDLSAAFPGEPHRGAEPGRRC